MPDFAYDRRIIFFTSPIGLGHASRDIAITQKLEKYLDEILFVSGGSAHDLISRAKFSALNLYKPPPFSIESGALHNSFQWLMRYLIYYKKSKKIAEEVITKYLHRNPIIVSDEDFASLANSKNPALQKKIFIYDILGTSIRAMGSSGSTYPMSGNKNNLGETHFTSGFLHLFEKEMNKRIRNLINKCDKVIIPDFGENRDNLEYVGPIVREINANRTTLRNTLGLTRKTVVVCTGGTDAGKYLIQQSLQAYEKLRSRIDLELIIVSGPNIRLNDSDGFRNLGFVDNLHEYIFASDLVVSLAGRSTMDESIVYGTPGIFIPIKGHFEQEQNAIRMGYKFEDIFRLETLIEEKLGSFRQGSLQKSNGAEITAKIITEML